jgi:hypothetical protein
MDIAKAALKGDTTLELQGLKLFLEERASDMLMSTMIDFQEGQGFFVFELLFLRSFRSTLPQVINSLPIFAKIQEIRLVN